MRARQMTSLTAGGRDLGSGWGESCGRVWGAIVANGVGNMHDAGVRQSGVVLLLILHKQKNYRGAWLGVRVWPLVLGE
jgi:hypothetical protein